MGHVKGTFDLATWFEIDRVAVAQVDAAFSRRVLATPVPETLSLPPRYIVLGPGCSELAKERQLRPDEWRSLLTDARLGGAAIVLLGGPSDRELCQAIVAELGSGYDLSGKLSLAKSAAVLARAERFYGIDSLLLHLARALNVPATSVWGPTEPASRLRARAAEDEVFYSKISCSPCVHVHDTPPCNGARICIPAALAAAPKPLAPLSPVVSVGWVIGPNDRDYRLVEVFNDWPATPQRALSRAHHE